MRHFLGAIFSGRNASSTIAERNTSGTIAFPRSKGDTGSGAYFIIAPGTMSCTSLTFAQLAGRCGSHDLNEPLLLPPEKLPILSWLDIKPSKSL
ncbi:MULTISPECIES: hypothetical protein [Bradyrhizobium]|uniref:hypothetical protein n=1 Tax=Bradyrhizobium TaxID=374 RepID=UPI00114CFA65|nr:MULTISPECIES: hypothetical protein [Bradyrhizobium]MCP1838892.1 hypothetical protein [Bradyrhizobium sp. USDA 4538]MCP1899459.1 hypothetical protein [Bradyrhizobium sp. USDA 4537]MCP1909736.1 hypothetical protein [Bradyrhizobium elkanii]MCP1986430.1 hypothetical protein [Bradyrhizobium sp. USDA 4539]